MYDTVVLAAADLIATDLDAKVDWQDEAASEYYGLDTGETALLGRLLAAVDPEDLRGALQAVLWRIPDDDEDQGEDGPGDEDGDHRYVPAQVAAENSIVQAVRAASAANELR